MISWNAHGLLRGYTYWETSNPFESYADSDNVYNWGTPSYAVKNSSTQRNIDGAMCLTQGGDLKIKGKLFCEAVNASNIDNDFDDLSQKVDDVSNQAFINTIQQINDLSNDVDTISNQVYVNIQQEIDNIANDTSNIDDLSQKLDDVSNQAFTEIDTISNQVYVNIQQEIDNIIANGNNTSNNDISNIDDLYQKVVENSNYIHDYFELVSNVKQNGQVTRRVNINTPGDESFIDDSNYSLQVDGKVRLEGGLDVGGNFKMYVNSLCNETGHYTVRRDSYRIIGGSPWNAHSSTNGYQFEIGSNTPQNI